MKRTIIFITLLTLVFSCSKTDPKKQILKLEKELTEAYRKGDTEKVKKVGEEAIKVYETLAKISQDPEEKATYIFKAAGYYISIFKNFDKAIYLLDKLIEKYPQTHISERAFFLKAYIFANELRKLQDAEKLYKEFLAKYPNSDLAEQAKQELRHLGKSPDEILKESNANPENS